MGLLEDLLASAMSGQGMGGQQAGGRAQQAPSAGGGMGNILMALLPVVLAMLANRGGGAQAGTGSGMGGGGGLGDILGQVLGGGQRGGAGGMGDILGQILGGGAAQSGMGGLGSLLEGFQRAGFGEQADSWVGTGENKPISPEAIEQVFGRGGLEAIARQAGISEADASRGLSELLPEVVNRVTPDGQVPDLDSLTASVEALARQYRSG